MTWIKFAFWLGGIYLAYYAALILWDIIRGSSSPVSSDAYELTFIEHVEPVRQDPEPVSEYQGSAVMSSGGVSLKQLFNLAREEAVEYTRSVSF
jgi:hypothetical protein